MFLSAVLCLTLVCVSLCVSLCVVVTAEEEEKRARDRAAMKAYQDRIYQENIDNIRRRQENKLNSHEEDRYVSRCFSSSPSLSVSALFSSVCSFLSLSPLSLSVL